jgi:hypothetical protein
MNCYRRRWIVLLLIGGLASAGCQQASSPAEDRSESSIANAATPAGDVLPVASGVSSSENPDTTRSTASPEDKTSAEGNASPTISNVKDDASLRVRPRLAIRSVGSRDITFDDLEFKIEKDAKFDRSMLTDAIDQLDGTQAVIRGFILPSYQEKGIKQFILVRDNQQCCFGPGAYIYHNIQVDMEEGQTASFSIRPVTVEGVFSIKPWIGPDEKCYSVYHILAKSVR